jgi:hypothetical protein
MSGTLLCSDGMPPVGSPIHWMRGTVVRLQRQDDFEIYYFDTNDVAPPRQCLIKFYEKRTKGFQDAARKGQTIQYAYAGNSRALLLDGFGNQRQATLGGEILRLRR